MYLALARKYRPQKFSEVIGQDPILQTLTHAIERDRVHHAYLFCGARGVGKTSMARIFAKSLNCEKGASANPCQECETCQSITAGKSMDVIEIDAASNTGVDNIRELREQVKYAPNGRYKVYIIDEVHMLSNSAFNALLKTLEEPPAHVMFILATTEPHEIPITILSRCQRYDFRKMNLPVLIQHLKRILTEEGASIDEEALHLVAECAQGSVRDSLSLLDQVIGFQKEGAVSESDVRSILGLGERLTLQEIFRAIVVNDLAGALTALNQVDQNGLDLKVFAEDLLKYYRNLILLKATGKLPVDVSPSEDQFFADLQKEMDLSLLVSQYQILFSAIQEISRSDFQKTSFEIALVKLSQAAQMIDLTSLVAELKNRRQGRAPAAQAQPPRQQAQAPVATNAQTPAPMTPTPANQSSSTEDKNRAAEQTAALPAPQNTASDWYALVKWVKKVKPPVGGLLNDAVPILYTDKKIEVGYPKNSTGRDMVIERQHVVESLLEKHFGHKVEFVVSEAEAGEKKKP